MTRDEFAETCTGLERESEWSSLSRLRTHEQDGTLQATVVEWTTQGVMTPMRQQGKCGSC